MSLVDALAGTQAAPGSIILNALQQQSPFLGRVPNLAGIRIPPELAQNLAKTSALLEPANVRSNPLFANLPERQQPGRAPAASDHVGDSPARRAGAPTWQLVPRH